MLSSLSERFAALNVELNVTPQACNLLTQAGFDPDYGARPLRRAIRNQVEDPAAELLLSNALPAGSVLTVDVRGDKLTLLPSPAALSAG